MRNQAVAYQHPNIMLIGPLSISLISGGRHQCSYKTAVGKYRPNQNWTRGSSTRNLHAKKHRDNILRRTATPATQPTVGEPETEKDQQPEAR
jgi:hypothetical protein